MLGIEDEIFARPPRSARRKAPKEAHITCRFCNRPATVPTDHPALLCGECLGDLDGVRETIAACVASLHRQLDENEARWFAARDAEPAWAKVQAAIEGVADGRIPQASLDATWAKRKAEAGRLAETLAAYEAFCQECDRISAEFTRLGRAQDEVNAAWMNTNQALDVPPVHAIEVRRAGQRFYATNGPRFTKWYDNEADAREEAATW